MKLILTHEQADFDALASSYGAHLLDESALPVMPRRLNRNVRAFVTLYGAEFPFVDQRDLPQETVEAVTLVDTQSLVTIKGMGKKTAIRVLDHHPRRSGLPENWQVSILETGATTTLLVESMQEHNGHLSVIQSTLLLLGIYEDTGSLSYGSTTPRDVRAAAYLLEQGASLKIAGDFLNPPLSSDQREVYDRLIANAQTHDINGHTVILACADARNLNEEISSLAHKIRDLLDPDALFVLVSTVEGVRIVARSTTDEIDVAAITAQFGGGGHDRAAAALIRVSSEQTRPVVLEETCHSLLEVLPRFIEPSITVSQIMSRGPQVLAPETPVQKAAKLMQRFGYEGYPVVRDGKVIGLLTRRAVDRATTHKLNLTAASLMEAGEVTVHPGDSLQVLQTRMTDSGWGQIPVADPESGEVIGIVTRTDLLNTLAPPETRRTEQNLANLLDDALPAARLELIRRVAEAASAQSMALYVVGGFVRDLLLQRPSLDFDIVVEGDAIVLAKALSRKHGGRVTSHNRFGTAKWFLQNSKLSRPKEIPSFLDLISARTEFYERPTALPTVERGSIKLDLHRRDFSINTLAIRLDGHHYGELYDYWGGVNDLERGLVRVLHSLSFVDDPTRMLRAVRFEQRFDFHIENRTQQLMDEARPLLEKLSSERIHHELDLMLDEPRAVAMLARLEDLGLLRAIHPDLPWDPAIQKRLAEGLEVEVPAEFGPISDLSGTPLRRVLGYLLWWLSLKPPALKSICKRLRISSSTTKILASATALWVDLPGLRKAKPSTWVRRLEDVPPIVVYAAYLAVSDAKVRQSLSDYLSKWRQIKASIDGHDLQARGLKPGPHYQEILWRLRQARLDGEISTLEEERELLNQMINQ
jgi:tRNA nucleotidyltransferase (CCA-adding enzyme)